MSEQIYKKDIRNNNRLDYEEKKEFNGIKIIKNFLKEEITDKINDEIDKYLEIPVCNSNIKGFSIISPYQKEISLPIVSIDSNNLMELACLVLDQFKTVKKIENYILTNIQIFSEKKNKTPMFWHTDQRKGMLRAQIYLRGGKKNSGGFMYMEGTNNFNHQVTHKLSKNEIDEMKDLIVDCSGEEGDLILFDSFGFHAKHPCVEERRTIMFEFQNKDSKFPKSTLIIDNKKLSPIVINNLKFFTPGDISTYGGHGFDNINRYTYKLIFFQKKIIILLNKCFKLLAILLRIIPRKIKDKIKSTLN